MPGAIPYQQGLIGLYNNSTSPGIYVSWDTDPSFSSCYSVIFKSPTYVNYKFPLIISNYGSGSATTKLNRPIALGAGITYIYCITDNEFVIYQKQAESFSTEYSISIQSSTLNSNYVPDSIKIASVNNQELILIGYGVTNLIKVYTFNGTTLSYFSQFTYSNISGISSNAFNGSFFDIDDNNLYITYSDSVYACNYVATGTSSISLTTSSSGVVISSSNGITTGNTLSKIDTYCNRKIAVVDNENNIYEFIYKGNIDAGNVTTRWGIGYMLTPTDDQVWSSILYNNFGVLVGADSANDTINVITSANVTTNTSNYETFDGYTYQVDSITTTENTEGSITNTVGSSGFAYLQFDNPLALAEDSDNNIIIADYNNRLTYLPTSLDYVSTINAPLNELIDTEGNPAEFYYVKQSSCDFSRTISLPPLNAEELLIKSSVLYELNALLRVAIYDEEPLYNYNRNSASLAYGDIVTDPAPQIRITSSTNSGQRSPMYVLSPFGGVYNTLDQSTDDPFNAPTENNNYTNGLFYRFTNEGVLHFMDSNGDSVSIAEYDTILVSYYVKLFTNRQINNALYLALQSINAQPGLNKIQNVASTPFWYDATLVSGACFYLIRQLLVGLNQRERRLLVMDPESGSFDAIANLKDLAKMYQDEFGELLKKLPIAKRPHMGTITVPEMAMPGGRNRLFRFLWKGQAG